MTNGLSLVMPQNVRMLDKDSGINYKAPRYPGESCIKPNVFIDENSVQEFAVKNGSNAGGKPYKVTYQHIENLGDVTVKKTVITPDFDVKGRNFAEFPDHVTFERLTDDGYYSVSRKVGDKVVGGYEMHLNPQDRQFAKGFKGRLQKAALAIGTDAKGCERPVLRRVASFLFNIAKKIK